MQILEPKVESWLQNDTIDHIARCARVCYASDKTTANDKMCNALWKNKHRSMFRHAGVYYIIPEKLHLQLLIQNKVKDYLIRYLCQL